MEVIELFKLLIIDLQLCVTHKNIQVGFKIQFKLIKKIKKYNKVLALQKICFEPLLCIKSFQHLEPQQMIVQLRIKESLLLSQTYDIPSLWSIHTYFNELS